MFQYSLRDLILLTVIAALSVAWWHDHSRLADEAKSRAKWQWRAESLADGLGAKGIQVTWGEEGMTVERPSAATPTAYEAIAK
jgi:5-enolpyruvylshikimate-3-phosphate synthase